MADVPSHLIASPVWSLCFTQFGASARVFCPLAAVLLVALAAPLAADAAAAAAGAASILALAFVAFAAAFGHLADPCVSLRLGFWVPCATFDLPLAPMFPSPVGRAFLRRFADHAALSEVTMAFAGINTSI
eukprot:CAMPEP_0172428152 /NCGR_PEP_ID=MMETSP1064-20121228/45215_1 /TAXON_ID=202472 /ORGANISM="Aulacoseira subarctica , Strain CCAP 1002/5" /LENGTH=130 /DNA_ID=CAMNT_0013172777 /DNA_START=255 /DNA_END=649 /DNA_ORIENTATION=+